MPDKLHRCVASVMETGKSEESAWAICNAQFADTYTGTFTDAAVYDPEERTALSVRDGVLRYLGAELNMQPPDKMFTVYRSPATIANTAMKMAGLPITDEHVSLDMEPPTDGGFVAEAEMVDATDPSTDTTIAIRNRLALGDTLRAMVDAGRRELSLGYRADLVPYDGPEGYDFEQRNIIPHHLATVDRGRCGPMCSFIDRKPSTEEGAEMPKPDKKELHAAFRDEDGAMNLQQIVELATALPEAIKAVPVDMLQELIPALQQIVEAAKGVMPAEEPPAESEQPPTEEGMEDQEPPKEDEQQFADRAAAKGFVDQKFVDQAIKNHTAAIDKAREFLPADYVFTDKSTAQIQRDALATISGDQFADSELALAFKLLKKPESSYRQFGDQQPTTLETLKDKEI